MTYYAINGSPRKTHNTATILNKALEGVKAADPQAQTELIHLYSHDFSGCVSCFECKRLGGKSYGKCAVRDGLTPILERLADADGIIFGSPVYFHSITGKMRMFFERPSSSISSTTPTVPRCPRNGCPRRSSTP